MIKRFDKSKIKDDLMGIITLSHGPLADAILESASVILGNEIENSAAFCLQADDDPFEYGNVISEAIDSFPAGCIIFVDLVGGSPYNQLVLNSRRKGIAPNAITAMSLPMIIVAQTLRKSGLSTDEILEQIYSESIQGVINVKKRVEGMIK